MLKTIEERTIVIESTDGNERLSFVVGVKDGAIVISKEKGCSIADVNGDHINDKEALIRIQED